MIMADTTQISFRISNDLLSRLRMVAQQEDRTMSNLLNRIVRHYLTSDDEIQIISRQPTVREES